MFLKSTNTKKYKIEMLTVKYKKYVYKGINSRSAVVCGFS